MSSKTINANVRPYKPLHEAKSLSEAYAQVMKWNSGHKINESTAQYIPDRRCHGEFINESNSKEDECVGDGQLHVFDYGEDAPFAERFVVIMPTGEKYDMSAGSGGIGWAASYDGDVGYSTRREMEEETLVVDYDGKTYHAAEVEDLSALPDGMPKRIMELAKDCDEDWGIEGDNENQDMVAKVFGEFNGRIGESAVNEGAFSRDVEKFDTNCDIVRTDFDTLSDIVKLSDPERDDWINDYIDHDSYAEIVEVDGIDDDIAKVVCLVNENDDDGTCLVGLIVRNRDDVVGDGEWQHSESEYADIISHIYAIADDVLADIPGDGEQKPEKFDGYWTGRTKKLRKNATETEGVTESEVPSFVKLNKISATDVENAIEWLKENDEGCYHFKVGDTDKNEIDICIGFHDDGDGWKIAWKIGMQSPHNAMQTDLDIDFDMPYDGESGDVYDTLTVLEDLDNLDYNAIAAEMNDVAEKVFAFQYDKDDEFVSSFED